MQKRHIDRDICFKEQGEITEKFVIPYILMGYTISSHSVVAEIGCGEAGNLRPFLEMGCNATGIDISEIRIERARKFYADHPLKDHLTLIAEDIFKLSCVQIGTFDLIIVRDTLEHIQNQEKFFSHTKKFLKPNGRIFVNFPPWRMPFGGHQQMCTNRFLSKIPYLHLLPKPLYLGILKSFNEKQYRIEELMAIRDSRVSISNFKKIVVHNRFKIEKEDFFLSNPAYEVKFNLKSRKLPGFLNIPYLRDLFTTVCFYILK